MARDVEGMPPPMRGARTQPDMRDDKGGGAYGKMSQLAGMGGEADAGGEEQAAQLVMSAAQQLMQAAQIHPQIQPMVGRVLAVLKSGVDEISGGGIGGEEELGIGGEGERGEKKPKKKKRMRPPTSEPQDEEEEMMGGY
jgi:hypothetical protein